MNSRQRLITTMQNKQADHVPASPDLWEMVPIRLSGKPSWDILVYQDPPIWKARMDAFEHYGTDAFIALHIPLSEQLKTAIVYDDGEKVIVRDFVENEDGVKWDTLVKVLTRNEPAARVQAESLGLKAEPKPSKVVQPNYGKVGKECFRDVCDYVGDRGVVAPIVCLPCIDHLPETMYEYYDNHETFTIRMQKTGNEMLQKTEEILSWQPDVLMIGNSGMMLFNPEPIFREICLGWLKQVTKMAKQYGVITHLHCCGPERRLVEIAANETDLSCIEPLEIRPMGDCCLKEIKNLFGSKIALKGNLHTTDMMLYGSVQEVENACKQAIDDAGEKGGFVLSTGDQTPRDTPDENIFAMQRIVETYGKY
jgi:uroporphyrinogen decarboxylase